MRLLVALWFAPVLWLACGPTADPDPYYPVDCLGAQCNGGAHAVP